MTSQLIKFLVIKLAKVAKRHSLEKLKKLESIRKELELAKRILRKERHEHLISAADYLKYQDYIARLEKIIEKKEEKI